MHYYALLVILLLGITADFRLPYHFINFCDFASFIFPLDWIGGVDRVLVWVGRCVWEGHKALFTSIQSSVELLDLSVYDNFICLCLASIATVLISSKVLCLEVIKDLLLLIQWQFLPLPHIPVILTTCLTFFCGKISQIIITTHVFLSPQCINMEFLVL